MVSLRDSLTIGQRAIDLKHTIDPGFVHYRKLNTIMNKFTKFIDKEIIALPPMPDWQRKVRIDHIYTKHLLFFCEQIGIKTLGEVLANGKGTLFCSTERVEPCANVYDTQRAISKWIPTGDYEYNVEFHYSTSLISSDTV